MLIKCLNELTLYLNSHNFLPSMFSFKEIPFVKLLLPFILGIYSGIYFIQASWFLLFNLLLIWVVLFVLAHKIIGKKYRYRFLLGTFLFIGFLGLGVMITNYHKPQFEAFTTNNKNTLVVSGSWKTTKRYYKAEAIIDPIAIGSKKRFTSPGKIMLYIPKDSTLELPKIGDRIITGQEIRKIYSPKNPYEFDYSKYLYHNRIVGNIYLKKNNYLTSSHNSGFPIKRLFNKWKQSITQIIDKQPMSSDTKALLQALLLGEKSNLDPEIKRAYVSAGAMHVLAVSGLHVGIVLLFINFFFKIFEFKQNGKYYHLTKSVIILLIIWIFAGITGFSPSITRATSMFSFLVVGKALNRNTNIYNSLAIAAFVLLFHNPFTLLSVGFQLSFLAVFGIAFFHPKIYPLVYFKNTLARKTWELTSVSISAQLTTFPLALLYFHQFPVYFLISNLVVIPFAFIIVISGLILIMVSPFQLVSGYLAYALDHVVHLLNYLVLGVEKLPYYKIGQVSITNTETFLIYFLITTTALYFIFKNVRYLIVSLFLATILLSANLYKKAENIKQNRLTFYSIYNHTAIDCVKNNKHIFIGDSLLLNLSEKINYHCANHWNTKGLSPIEDTQKAILYTSDEFPDLDILLTKNHLVFENTLICFNHSSHDLIYMQHFKNRILFVNKYFYNSWEHIEQYDYILLNNNIYNYKDTVILNTILENSKTLLHNINSGGSFNYEL